MLGQRRAQEIAAQVFKARAIVWANPDTGVKIEAIELGLARSARGGVARSGLGSEATHARASARAESAAALDGGANEPGQDGGGLGEGAGQGAVVLGLESAASEKPPHAGPVCEARSNSSRCAERWLGELACWRPLDVVDVDAVDRIGNDVPQLIAAIFQHREHDVGSRRAGTDPHADHAVGL